MSKMVFLWLEVCVCVDVSVCVFCWALIFVNGFLRAGWLVMLRAALVPREALEDALEDPR